MSKKSNMLLGLGIGGAIVGLGGTVAALAIAHNKAKKHNKTTSQYLKDKALGIKNRKKRCYKCGDIIPCDCDSINDDDYDELLEELDAVKTEDFDEFCEITTNEMENLEKERDEWKRKYEELVASLTNTNE